MFAANRTGGALIALGVAAAVLSGCGGTSKKPAVINLADGDAKATVQPQALCVVGGTCALDQSKVADLTAPGGTYLLVGVSKELADAGYVAAAYTQSGGKNTAIPNAGTTGVSNDVAIRLPVPTSTGGYIIQFTALKPSERLTTWLVRVTIGT